MWTMYKSMLIIGLLILTVSASMTHAQYSWEPGERDYPWIDYLASLTIERNVRLVILTRHESSIQTFTRSMFLQSDVAKKLGIGEIQFL